MIHSFITKKEIPQTEKLKYLIAIPCVNRLERNAVNVIERTFESFEKSGLFSSDIHIDIYLFESGSKDKSYLDFLKKFKDMNGKYQKNIEIIDTNLQLNAVSNTLRMMYYINKYKKKEYDFIIWMDDDIFVCKNFIKNADIWIKKYGNFSIFSSLYIPYNSTQVNKCLALADISHFYGTCCTIFKPALSKYLLKNWYNPHFEKFQYNPDTRFRDTVQLHFPTAKRICVSYPSLVEHMNIGSAIRYRKVEHSGHKSKIFIGEDTDPLLEKYILHNKLLNLQFTPQPIIIEEDPPQNNTQIIIEKENKEIIEKIVEDFVIDQIIEPIFETAIIESNIEIVINEQVINEPVINESAVNEQVINEPVINELVVNESVVNESAVNESVVNESVVNESVVNEQVINEPVINDIVVNESVVNESVVNESIIKNKIVEENDKESKKEKRKYNRKK